MPSSKKPASNEQVDGAKHVPYFNSYIEGILCPSHGTQTRDEDKKGSQQNIIVHGDVGQIAGRDFNINYFQPNFYLNILERAIQEAEHIPEEDKKSIGAKIKDLKDNQWIVGIGSSAIFEIGKKMIGL